MLFTHDSKTVAIIDEVLYILFLYIFFDTIHGVQSGIIRGLGLQVWGAIYTLVCYYLIGLPWALTQAFKKDKGVYGLWFGFSIACIALDIGLFAICECPSWEKIAKEMQQQIDSTQKQKILDAKTLPSKEDYSSVGATPESRRLMRQKSISRISSSGKIDDYK